MHFIEDRKYFSSVIHLSRVAAKFLLLFAYILWIFSGFFTFQSTKASQLSQIHKKGSGIIKSNAGYICENAFALNNTEKVSLLQEQVLAEENEDAHDDFDFTPGRFHTQTYHSGEKPLNLLSSEHSTGGFIALYVLYHCWKSFLA